jgi:HSP20 family molecular chaperone IbpA
MAMTETKPQVETEKQIPAPKHYFTPHYRVYLNEEKYHVEVELPGVERADIKTKAMSDALVLEGRRDEVQYDLHLDFYYEIEPEKIKATYHQGLLKMDIPLYNRTENAKEIPIQ